MLVFYFPCWLWLNTKITEKVQHWALACLASKKTCTSEYISAQRMCSVHGVISTGHNMPTKVVAAHNSTRPILVTAKVYKKTVTSQNKGLLHNAYV